MGVEGYAQNAWLNWILKGVQPAAITPHLGLILDDGTEVSGTDYARVPLADKYATESDGDGSSANTSLIQFASANTDWTTSPWKITHVVIFTELTGGSKVKTADLGYAPGEGHEVQAAEESLDIPISQLTWTIS